MSEEGARVEPRFGVGAETPKALNLLSTIPEYEIYPLTRYRATIGYLSMVEDNLLMVACPTFTKPRAHSTFSFYRIPFADFHDYCTNIEHTSEFGAIVYNYIYLRKIVPIVSGIPNLQDALTHITTEARAPLQ